MTLIENAADNKTLFIELFNRYTVYAPFTIKIDEQIFDKHIFGYNQDAQNCILTASKSAEQRNEPEHGIIHFGKTGDNRGMIYLLFADNVNIALELLQKAEEWFIANNTLNIRAFVCHPSPYQYILHGSEPYCWAGNYNANNAFRRKDYDMDFDLLVMSMKLHEVKVKTCEGFEIKEEIVRDDDLAKMGKFSIHKDGNWVGQCCYHYLKALSAQLGKKHGQVDIWLNDFHGTGLGEYMMSLSHNALLNLGVERVMLATNQALFRAIKFYEKLGYTAEPIKAYSYTQTLAK